MLNTSKCDRVRALEKTTVSSRWDPNEHGSAPEDSINCACSSMCQCDGNPLVHDAGIRQHSCSRNLDYHFAPSRIQYPRQNAMSTKTATMLRGTSRRATVVAPPVACTADNTEENLGHVARSLAAEAGPTQATRIGVRLRVRDAEVLYNLRR